MSLLLTHTIAGTGRPYPAKSKTLLQILVEELPKRGGWPEGVKWLAQTPGGSILGRETSQSGPFFSLVLDTVADDYRTAKVTRDQYEAALANREASQVKPCPTMGAECLGCPDCGRRVSCTSDDITDAALKSEADGWIEWHGGECPVPANTLVDVKQRDNWFSENSYADSWRWKHDGHHSDIIAYRLHQPQDANSRANDDRLAQDFGAVADEADLNECIGQAAPEWDGQGLPPVGAEFNYGSHRSRAKCLAVGLHYVFASKGNPDDEDGDYEELLIDALTEFRQVDEVRDSLVREIMALRTPEHTAVLIANKLLAAGYRKQ